MHFCTPLRLTPAAAYGSHIIQPLKMRILPKFNGCSMRHGARILVRKWREGITPKRLTPFFSKNGDIALLLTTSWGASELGVSLWFAGQLADGLKGPGSSRWNPKPTCTETSSPG
jgi:hypothetical protein